MLNLSKLKSSILVVLALLMVSSICFTASATTETSTATSSYENVSETGVFYIKSHNGKYLTLSDDKLTFTDYTGENNQKWVTEKLDKKSYYAIRPAFGSVTDSISCGKSLAGSYVISTKIGNVPMRFKFYSTENREGKVFFYSDGNYYLNYSGNLLGYFKTVTDLVPTSDSYYFELEKLPYQIGDVDMSGKVDISDATAMQKILVGMNEEYAIHKYLADVNGDGVFDINDVTYLQSQLTH